VAPAQLEGSVNIVASRIGTLRLRVAQRDSKAPRETRPESWMSELRMAPSESLVMRGERPKSAKQATKVRWKAR
jgi:hypothetical protein